MHEDTESLKLFVERLTEAQSALYGCIHAMMAGAPAVADVLQETNRVLWKKAAEYDSSRTFLPWAYRVAHFEPQHGGRPSPQIASLVEGEAVQVSSKGAKKRVTCVFTTGDSGDWSRKPPLGALITDVHDSTEEAGSNHFYRVGVGSLTTGTSLRQTNPLSWRTLDGSPLPDWLEGGDWAETGSDEDADVDLQVTLARPAVLFVLQDVRRAPPAWLRDRFTDTGTRLLLERSSAKASGEGKSPQPFTVWSMKVSQPGTVTLGPSFDPGQAAKGRRYRVAAKAFP